MASSPQYVGTAKSPSVAISAANTNRDGTTGTYGTVMTAGASGSRVDRINITASGASTTAGMIRLFLGSALIKEVPVIAITPSATQPAWSTEVVFDNGLVLQASAVLKASTEKAEAFNVTVVSGGDF
jgi:hypothetical protein